MKQGFHNVASKKMFRTLSGCFMAEGLAPGCIQLLNKSYNYTELRMVHHEQN
jgi:hypothetical protein